MKNTSDRPFIDTMLSAQNHGAANLDRYLARLGNIYRKMDTAYQEVALYYGASCYGCDGDCCKSYFFHHTVAEYLFLMKGFRNLEKHRRYEIKALAHQFVTERDRLQAGGEKIDIMCPLSRDGLCGLYEHRPMICRLHGVPFAYMRPDRVKIKGEGCPELVSAEEHGLRGKELDRTWLYRDMAMLERELRQEIGFDQRIKMTIADMIASGERENASGV